ncbi:MAG: hypothetical protein ABIV25_00040 [Paracoccaceae bacterium]
MKLTQKNVGLSIAAVAVVLMGSAAIADNMGNGKPMGGPMMEPPAFNFEAIDANKDGKISQDEVTAWRLAQTAGVDVNGDGKLSVDELAAMRLKQMTEAAKVQAQNMVDRLDTDGDHLLSAAELVAAPMAPHLFDRVDANKDGFIDKAEADAAMQKMREHAGRDHRGKRPPMQGDAPPPPAPDGTSGN